jgi:hypothetical protein
MRRSEMRRSEVRRISLISGLVLPAVLLLGPLAAGARPRQSPSPAIAVAPAAAEPAAAEAEKTPSKPRVQRLSFDDDVVSARRDLGDGDILVAHRKPKLPSLVKPRLDFIPELIKSADTF